MSCFRGTRPRDEPEEDSFLFERIRDLQQRVSRAAVTVHGLWTISGHEHLHQPLLISLIRVGQAQ
ncbi:hypothetical protein AMELA_G00060340, partial [Ameiurus melas]